LGGAGKLWIDITSAVWQLATRCLILGVGFRGQAIQWRHSRDRESKGRCHGNQFWDCISCKRTLTEDNDMRLSCKGWFVITHLWRWELLQTGDCQVGNWHVNCQHSSWRYFASWAPWVDIDFRSFRHVVKLHRHGNFAQRYFPVLLQVDVVWPGGVMVRALACDSRSREFNSRPFRYQVTTLGKLFTHMCLCYQVA